MDICPLRPEDVEPIGFVDGGNGWKRDRQSWQARLSEQESGRRTVLVAWDLGRPIGYGSLLAPSGYPPFAAAGIPEIHDLSVAARCRGRGVATALIGALEAMAAKAGHGEVGIGVGLYADYGSAQRLYARLGYVPDGRGVTSWGKPIVPGSRVRVDDELVLWMTRRL